MGRLVHTGLGSSSLIAQHVLVERTPEAIAAAVSVAAAAIAVTDALLFTTGAGMGVDMGLADFRSLEKFWVTEWRPAAEGGGDRALELV